MGRSAVTVACLWRMPNPHDDNGFKVKLAERTLDAVLAEAKEAEPMKFDTPATNNPIDRLKPSVSDRPHRRHVTRRPAPRPMPYEWHDVVSAIRPMASLWAPQSRKDASPSMDLAAAQGGAWRTRDRHGATCRKLRRGRVQYGYAVRRPANRTTITRPWRWSWPTLSNRRATRRRMITYRLCRRGRKLRPRRSERHGRHGRERLLGRARDAHAVISMARSPQLQCALSNLHHA